MIKVTVGNNTNRENTIIDENNTTLREAFESQGIGTDGCQVLMNGVMVRAGDIDRTFAELGVNKSATLFAMAKTDNATR